MRYAITDIESAGWTAAGAYSRTVLRSLLAVEKESPSVHLGFITSNHFSPDPSIELVQLSTNRQVLPFETRVRRRLHLETRVAPFPGERRLRQGLRISNPTDPAWLAARLEFDAVYPIMGVPPKTSSIGLAAWIPDLQHRTLPEFFSRREVEKRDSLIHHLISRCHAVCISSESSRHDLERFYPAARGKAFVLRFPSRYAVDKVAPQPWIRQKYHLPDRFMLCANQFWIHKNHLALLEALSMAVREDPTITVVMTGLLADHRDPTGSHLSHVVQAIATHGLHANVRLLGLVPFVDLDALLMEAIAVIQPSLSEGWNTTVQDAKAVGKPVLAFDSNVLREQVPQATFFKDASTCATGLLELSHAPFASLSDTPQKVERQVMTEFARGLLDVLALSASGARKRL